jgi:protocatechuate 3,4-dioxygenase beta subunit
VKLNRRSLVAYGALFGSTALLPVRQAAAWSLFKSTKDDSNFAIGDNRVDSQVCTLAPAQTKGPYYFESPQRSNIREDRLGLPLNLKVQIVDVKTCQPLGGAIVEIWHADNQGNYSGFRANSRRRKHDIIDTSSLAYSSTSETFLRGGQYSDDNGMVEFETVFPGWYVSRVAHIHLRVHHNSKTYLTTQLYFDDELVKSIYTTHPDYKPFGFVPQSIKTDSVSRRSNNIHRLLLNIDEGANGLSAQIKLGVS